MKKKIKEPVINDPLLKEIDKELKNEHMKNLWDRFGLVIILCVATILTLTVSFETLRSWNKKQTQELSNAYAVAVSMQSQGRYDESLKILEKLAAADKGIYSDIANLQIANILFEQGKNAEAMDMLEKISKNDDFNQQMRDIAIIKLASYKLDTNTSAADIKAMLEPLSKSDGNWSNIAHELLAMLAIREGDINQAKTEYEAIVNSANVQDSMKARAQEMLSILNDETTKK